MYDRETLVSLLIISRIFFWGGRRGGGEESEKEMINNCILRAKESFGLYCSLFYITNVSGIC